MTATFTPDQPSFNVLQAAKYLQVGPRIVRRLVQQKKLAHTKIDKRGTVRISRQALEQLLMGGSSK